MPNYIIIDLNKSILDSDTEKKEENGNVDVLLTLPVQINFKKDELENILTYIKNNEKFESLRIKIPGYFNLNSILTEDIIQEKISKLIITINEKKNVGPSSAMEFQ